MKGGAERAQATAGWVFAAPALGLIGLFFFVPVVAGLVLSLTGRYSRSPVAFEMVETGYNSSVGSVRLQYGFTRNLAVNGEYLYYQYDFGEDAIVPPGFARDLERQVVRVGVTFGVPLYRQR